MKTILYIRSNEDYSSYQKQEKALYAYCNKNNLQVVTRPFTDNSLDNDDTIHKMFEYCINNKGNVDCILFYDWSRVSRDIQKLTNFYRAFEIELKINLLSINSPESLTFCMEQARIREKEIRRNRIKDGIRCKRMRRQG